jgi:hypothetical protein
MSPTRRANIGCGSIQPADWFNFDVEIGTGAMWWDVRKPLTGASFNGYFEYAVCSFMLQELDHHEIPGGLENIAATIKKGGVLRILVADIMKAVSAYQAHDEEWFPQDSRTGGLEAKFCTYLTWYGTARSVFTVNYLCSMMLKTGLFSAIKGCPFGETAFCSDLEITSLDARLPEALIVEGVIR